MFTFYELSDEYKESYKTIPEGFKTIRKTNGYKNTVLFGVIVKERKLKLEIELKKSEIESFFLEDCSDYIETEYKWVVKRELNN